MDRMFCLENDLLRGRCSLRELLRRCLPWSLPWLDGSDMDEPCADRGKVLGRSKVILSREDLFSVEARHRFGHLSWRESFFVHTITHHFTFLAFFSWFFVQRPCILVVFSLESCIYSPQILTALRQCHSLFMKDPRRILKSSSNIRRAFLSASPHL